MKKLLLFLLCLVPFSVSATPIQVGTIPMNPFYMYRTTQDNVLYFTASTTGILTYKKDGTAGPATSSINLTSSMTPFIIESEENIYFFYRYYLFSSPNRYESFYVTKYSKTYDSFSPFYNLIGGRWNGASCVTNGNIYYAGCSNSVNALYRFYMNGTELELLSDYNGASITRVKFTDINETGTGITHTGSTNTKLYSNYQLYASTYVYRASLNQLSYLDKSLKTFNWVLTDAQGDIVRVNDVFISTYTFNGYTYFYNEDTGSVTFSIFGQTDSLRSYLDYELGSSDYTNGLGYVDVIDGQLVSVNSSMNINYNQLYNGPSIRLLNFTGSYIYYYSSGSVLYKDSIVNTGGILADFPTIANGGVTTNTATFLCNNWWCFGTSPFVSNSGSTINEYTGSGNVETVFQGDFDMDGDGNVSFGEFINGTAGSIKNFFVAIPEFFGGIKDLFDSLKDFGNTVEVKTLSFIIPQANASAIADNFNTDSTDLNGGTNIISNIWKLIVGVIFAYFFFEIIMLIVHLKSKKQE